MTSSLDSSIPAETRKSRTCSARFWPSARLPSGVPLGSACPSITTRASLLLFIQRIARPSVRAASGPTLELLRAKNSSPRIAPLATGAAGSASRDGRVAGGGGVTFATTSEGGGAGGAGVGDAVSPAGDGSLVSLLATTRRLGGCCGP